MIGRRIRAGAATVLGDLAQATGPWNYESWEEILRHLGLEDAAVEQLTYAYRVPRQIMEAALPILAFTAPATAPPVAYREGRSSPVWVRVEREARATTAVSNAVRLQLMGGTTAIIAPSSLAAELRTQLDASRVGYDDAGREELGNSIELIDPVVAKGLEFDHVVLVEPAVLIREHPDGRGLRELYVALTRPTQSLVCVHCEDLPWPLGQLEPDADASRKATGTTPVADRTVPSPPPSVVQLSVGEALDVARKRGMKYEEMAAIVLLASLRDLTDAEIAAAVLDPVSRSSDVVSALISKARELVAD